jgi:hypothetical protein
LHIFLFDNAWSEVFIQLYMLDDVESDLKKMKVKGWKEKMRNREQWRLVVEEAKAHPGLQGRVAEEEAEGGKEDGEEELY